jgi:acyl-homoserine lactone acylase PvdQ
MKFPVPNYSSLQNPWLGGYRHQIPVLSVLCPQLNLLNTPPKKIPGYATDVDVRKANQQSTVKHKYEYIVYISYCIVYSATCFGLRYSQHQAAYIK